MRMGSLSREVLITERDNRDVSDLRVAWLMHHDASVTYNFLPVPGHIPDVAYLINSAFLDVKLCVPWIIAMAGP